VYRACLVTQDANADHRWLKREQQLEGVGYKDFMLCCLGRDAAGVRDSTCWCRGTP